MKQFKKSVLCFFTVLLFVVANLGVSSASEPQILLKTEEIGSHDWSKKPPVLSGFNFKTVDIDKVFADESGKRQGSALNWKSMISNERYFDDYEIENRIVEYVTGPSRFGFLGVFVFKGENRILPADRKICSERVDLINKKFGSTSVLKDRSSSEFERIKAQWLVGNTIADYTCTHFVSEVEGGLKKTVIEFSTLGVDFVDRVKQLTPLVALSCDFQASRVEFKDGSENTTSNGEIKRLRITFFVDVDTNDVLSADEKVLDRDATINGNSVVAKWSNSKKVDSTLNISRLDGSASFRRETEKMFVIQPGECEKVDLKKKLF
jgi:hypothetical protein